MYKTLFSLFTLSLVLLFASEELIAQINRMIVAPDVYYLDGNASPYKDLKPGDTLFFQGGSKQYLQIKNFQGSTRLPIVFTNLNGMVTINTTWHYGIKIANCR